MGPGSAALDPRGTSHTAITCRYVSCVLNGYCEVTGKRGIILFFTVKSMIYVDGKESYSYILKFRAARQPL